MWKSYIHLFTKNFFNISHILGIVWGTEDKIVIKYSPYLNRVYNLGKQRDINQTIIKMM